MKQSARSNPTELEVRFLRLGLPFSDRMKRRIRDTFNTSEPHPLYYWLENSEWYGLLQQALSGISHYDRIRKTSWLKKAAKKSTCADKGQLRDNVMEMIVVGYYMNKYARLNSVQVEWEREWAKTGNREVPNVDVSIIGMLSTPVNIEVKVLGIGGYEVKIIEFRTKLLRELRKQVASKGIPGYWYAFYVDIDRSDYDTVENWYMPEVASSVMSFAKEHANSPSGRYQTKLGNGTDVHLVISSTPPKGGSLVILSVTSYEKSEGGRVKSKIVLPAKYQFPPGEINVCCLVNQSSADDIDILEGLLGKEQLLVSNFNAKSVRFLRRPDGAFQEICDCNLNPVWGVIVFQQSFTEKRIIRNPNGNTEPEIELVLR